MNRTVTKVVLKRLLRFTTGIVGYYRTVTKVVLKRLANAPNDEEIEYRTVTKVVLKRKRCRYYSTNRK